MQIPVSFRWRGFLLWATGLNADANSVLHRSGPLPSGKRYSTHQRAPL
jgi:hypothetical protein